MKNSTNIILIIAIVIALAVAGYFIFKPKTTTSEEDTEGEGQTNTNTATNKNNDFYPPTTPPIVSPTSPSSPTPPRENSCGYLKYKRESDAPPFKLLPDAELYKNTDSFVNKMRTEGHSDEYISYAAAFLKGMDLALKVDIVRQYSKEILHFKSRAEILRNGNFRLEVQNQKYDVGTLICESNILLRLGLVNRNIFR
jgi:hypothetical protein